MLLHAWATTGLDHYPASILMVTVNTIIGAHPCANARTRSSVAQPCHTVLYQYRGGDKVAIFEHGLRTRHLSEQAIWETPREPCASTEPDNSGWSGCPSRMPLTTSS